MGLSMALLAAHVPSICYEERAPEFQNELVNGLHRMQERIDHLKADAIVLMSCHFPGTFHHYVDATPIHRGILTAVECPDLISDVEYEYPGDAELARELTEAGKQISLPITAFNDPAYIWDYGTLVPLRYLVPKQNIPIVNLSVCWASSLEESYQWGVQIGKVLRESSKRIVFVSSGAMSHNLVRGRENMPTRSERAMDNQFLEYLLSSDYAGAREMLTQYARIAGVESGGRHLATLLGVLEKERAEYFGYGQSSGSGNAIVSFT
jgi:3,4-dihydroxyphenylacetate 2,3-dioxygenase